MYPYLNSISYFGNIGMSMFRGQGGGEAVECVAGLAETIESPTPVNVGQFGGGIKIRGNEMFVGERQAVGSIFQVGEIHFFNRADANSNWTRQSGWFAPVQLNGARFGNGLDYDGTHIISGSPGVNDCDIFSWSAPTATHVQKIEADTLTGSHNFGYGNSIKGNHALIGAPLFDGTVPNTTNSGGIEYWSDVVSPGTWVFQQAFEPNTREASGAFGSGIAMIDDATAFITRVHGAVFASTAVVVEKWTRSGTTWSYDSQWSHTVKVTAGNLPCLDTDGTNLILGLETWDAALITTSQEGSVVVLSQAGAELAVLEHDTAGDQFGYCCTIAGGEIGVGLVFAHNGATNDAGRVETYDICV